MSETRENVNMDSHPWRWRMIVRGSFQSAWRDAEQDERALVFRRWIAVHSGWQEAGCRLVASMDDVAMIGEALPGQCHFYTVWEIPRPDMVYDLLRPFYHEVFEDAGEQVNLSRYFSLQTIVGKPIGSMERELGGPQQAASPPAPTPSAPVAGG